MRPDTSLPSVQVRQVAEVWGSLRSLRRAGQPGRGVAGDERGRVRLSWAAAFTLAIAYGGGLWLQLVHTVEGATELDEPPFIIHWLRDSTLALPIVFAGVWVALLVVRRLVEPRAERLPPFFADLLLAAAVAATTSALIAVVSPAHELLFGTSPHGGEDFPTLVAGIARDSSIPATYRQLLLQATPVVTHIVRDGMLALGGNFLVATAVVALLGEEVNGGHPEQHEELEGKRQSMRSRRTTL